MIASPIPGYGCPGRCSLVFWRKGERRKGHHDCERPNVYRCTLCDHIETGRCGARREKNCKPCAERHRKDVRRVILSGCRDRPEGVFFITLTAPGSDVLSWDRELCTHPPEVQCSGKDHGCKVERFEAAIWNAAAPRAWNDFVTDLRRLLPGVDVQHSGAWETQERGMLHRHALVGAAGVSESRMRVFVRVLAKRHGFGPQVDVKAISGGDARQLARTAGYIASYVSKGSHRAVCLNSETGELRLDGSGYRAWSRSLGWGTSLAAIKLERIAYVVAWLAERGLAAQPLPALGDHAGGADWELRVGAAPAVLLC